MIVSDIFLLSATILGLTSLANPTAVDRFAMAQQSRDGFWDVYSSRAVDDRAREAMLGYLASIEAKHPDATVLIHYTPRMSDDEKVISAAEFGALIAHCSEREIQGAQYDDRRKTGVWVSWSKCDDGKPNRAALFQLYEGKLARVDAIGWTMPLPPAPPSMRNRSGSN